MKWNKFDYLAIICSIISCIIVFICAIIHGLDSFTIFTFIIGVLLGSYPLSLNICMTLRLLIATLIMRKKNVILRNWETIEELGRVSCIWTNMTGVLTDKKYKVTSLYYNNKFKKVEKEEFFKDWNHCYEERKNELSCSESTFEKLMETIALSCSTEIREEITEEEIKIGIGKKLQK